MARNSRKAPTFAEAACELARMLTRDVLDPYRPELHYMRGPGPKWHAKHDEPRQPAPQGLRPARA